MIERPSMLTLKQMQEFCTMTMGRPCKKIGNDRREIAHHVIDVFYFSCFYVETGIQYRWQMFVDGRADTGGTIR